MSIPPKMTSDSGRRTGYSAESALFLFLTLSGQLQSTFSHRLIVSPDVVYEC